jgi:hypothetical protein
MKKLRLFKDRGTHQANYSGDLRGLDTNLLARSHKQVQLIVLGDLDKNSVSEIAAAYGFKSIHSNGRHLLSANISISGDHKRQALAAFFIALEIFSVHPTSRCLLVERDGLMEVLLENAKQTSNQFENQLGSWVLMKERLTLDSPISLYLSQAGIPISASTSRTYVDHQVEEIRRHLIASNLSNIKKAA